MNKVDNQYFEKIIYLNIKMLKKIYKKIDKYSLNH